jgi:hypothetical protein
MKKLIRIKDVVGYEGLYYITINGDLFSCRSKKFVKWHDRSGYVYYSLSDCNGKVKRRSAHQLVAKAFIPNPENKYSVNHIDRNKLNNHISNLEWATHEEQMKHFVLTNKLDIVAKTKKPLFYVLDKYSLEILDTYSSIKQCSIDYSVCHRSISNTLKSNSNFNKYKQLYFVYCKDYDYFMSINEPYISNINNVNSDTNINIPHIERTYSKQRKDYTPKVPNKFKDVQLHPSASFYDD